MLNIERELDRYLTLLRDKISQRNFTQLEVQEVLGWGRSYISQLLTKQKSLRLEQVLAILQVIDVDPSEFFAELYVAGANQGAASLRPLAGQSEANDLPQELQRLNALTQGLIELLREKNLISAAGLAEAVNTARRENF